MCMASEHVIFMFLLGSLGNDILELVLLLPRFNYAIMI